MLQWSELYGGYELRPLRAGQVGVITRQGGELVALRATPVAGGALTWQTLDAQTGMARSAVAGFQRARQQLHSGEVATPCAVTQRQLMQLTAHRAALLALTGAGHFTEHADRAFSEVVDAAAGANVHIALSLLMGLGLDVGPSEARVALQLVINLAVEHQCAAALDHLQVGPNAHDAIAAASAWLSCHATPALLNTLSDLSTQCTLAQQLLRPRNPVFALSA